MYTYQVTYHFEKDLVVQRLVEAESKEDAIFDVESDTWSFFETDHGELVCLNNNFVKFVTVKEV